MFQQLIIPIKLEAVINSYIYVAEQNIFRTFKWSNLSPEIRKSVSHEIF